MYRSLCCTLVRRLRATQALYGLSGWRAANGAGPSECTAGVTPAPSENLGQDD